MNNCAFCWKICLMVSNWNFQYTYIHCKYTKRFVIMKNEYIYDELSGNRVMGMQISKIIISVVVILATTQKITYIFCNILIFSEITLHRALVMNESLKASQQRMMTLWIFLSLILCIFNHYNVKRTQNINKFSNNVTGFPGLTETNYDEK